jgi:hypothetical protein
MNRPSFVLVLIVALLSVMLGLTAVSAKRETARHNNEIPTESKAITPQPFFRSANQAATPLKLDGCVPRADRADAQVWHNRRAREAE